MDRTRSPLPDRLLDTLEQLLRLPAGEVKDTLTHVSDVLAEATGADKVDAFMYDPARDSLVAAGSSTQPLSLLQRSLGLDVLPISNGGRSVEVYRTGNTALIGRVEQDEAELKGIREALGVRALLAVPIDIGGKRRGVLMLTSKTPEYFTQEDARFVAAAGRWVGVVVHRAEMAEEIARNAAEQGRRAGAEELVTVVAHDLRNYLAPVGLRLELLRVRAQQAGRADDLADVAAMSRSIHRLGTLVNDILDVARIDRGMFHVSLEALDLGALVAEVVATLTSAQHPLHLRVEEGESIRVAGDAGRLRQTLENVIANAIQKSPADAAVSVFVTRSRPREGQPRARVEVVDQGPGIPPDVLPYVFEPFFTQKSGEGGLGLGLYLARRIAVLHGGDLTAQSRAGAGARFSLVLPALPDPEDSR